MIDEYKRLSNMLPKAYPKLRFQNHCYLRIALDNALGFKWDTQLPRPAYKNLTKDQMIEVIGNLRMYLFRQDILLQHNKKSLQWRIH